MVCDWWPVTSESPWTCVTGSQSHYPASHAIYTAETGRPPTATLPSRSAAAAKLRPIAAIWGLWISESVDFIAEHRTTKDNRAEIVVMRFGLVDSTDKKRVAFSPRAGACARTIP